MLPLTVLLSLTGFTKKLHLYCMMCFLLQVFHCVHFECPADTAALAEYEKQHPHRQAAVSMELVPVIPNDLRIVTPRSGQQENMRLQGLGGIREEGAVDHGDGYGIGLLGGSGSPAFFPQHH